MAEKRKSSRYWISGTKNLDTNLIIILMFLVVFGLIMVYSASYYRCSMNKEFNYDSLYFLKNQVKMSILGIVVMGIISCINYHFWNRKPIIFLAIALSIILTLMLKVPALSKTFNGATRWVKIGSISFQVAEPVKIAVIVTTAYLASLFGAKEVYWKAFKWKHWKKTFIILLPGVGLSLFLGIISSNMSTAIIIAMIGVAMYFAWHPKQWQFFVAALAGGIVVVIVLYIMPRLPMEVIEKLIEKSYHVARVYAWIDPYTYASDVGFQGLQALYAIGSGGLFGKGLGNSIQKLGKIPEPYNDFIFAIVCEELGVLGASLLVLMFIYLLYRIFIIAQHAEDLFGKMLATGVFCHIALQVVLNIAVVTSFIPNTGVTLPFISYGGTATVLLFIEMGMVLNVQKWGALRREENIKMKKLR